MFCVYYPGSSYAQQLIFTPRENVIFATLNQLQEREEAMRTSLKEAQVKLLRENLAVKKNKVTLVSSIASRLHPYLNTDSANNDNVDSTPSNRKSSVIHTVTPGVKLSLSQKNRFLSFDAYINNLYYNNRARSNTQDANLDMLGNFNFGRYSLSLTNDYFNNYIAQPHFNIKKDGLAHYWKNIFEADIRGNYNRYDYNFGFSHAVSRYEKDSKVGLDLGEDKFSLDQYLVLTPKTQLSLQYSHIRDHHDYKESNGTDFNSNEYILTLTKILSYKFSSSLGIDYEAQNYKATSDKRTTIFRGSLAYRLSDHSDMSLSFDHTIYDEKQTHSNYYLENTLDISIRHRFIAHPKLVIHYDYNIDYFDYLKKYSVQYANVRKNTFGLTYAYKKWLDLGLDYIYTDKYFNYIPKYENTEIVFSSQARF